MKKLTIAALACAMPLTASAGGFGFTTHSGTSYSQGIGYGGSAFHDLPSLDFRQSGWTIQVDALELLHGLTVEEGDARQLHLGLNAYKTVQRHDIRDHLGGVVQPGFSVDVDSNSGFDPMDFDLQLQVRMGARAQTPGGMGVGLYVVPGLGVASFAGETGLAVSGGMQIGVWRNSGD